MWRNPRNDGAGLHDFEDIDEEIELQPILEYLAEQRPLDLSISDETKARLTGIVGGLSVALARAFKIIDPDLKHPRSEQWRRAFRLFDLLL